MTTEQCVSHGTGRTAMPVHEQALHELVAAMNPLDASDGPLNLDAVVRIRQRQFDDWILAAARSGLVTAREIGTIVQSWDASPRSLFDALLAGSDDLTRRRYHAIWNSLGTLDAREYA
ncbi:hypothetical protein ACFTWF_24540 [Rhodococcus sp. NPDC056960]|uniref:hypothetical protein n=1 Tax=Rhodococcus sp. NPDC056960 TaxID=3345982 RepID=UPI00363C01EE